MADEEGSNSERKGHHRRQSSEPPLVNLLSSCEEESRRQLFERTWSTNDVQRQERNSFPLSVASSHRRESTQPIDMSQFHESWTTSESCGFLGGASFSSSSMTGSWAGNYSHNPTESRRSVSITSTSSEPGLSAIHDAARITNWDTVIRLCQTHPHYASYVGQRDGWTALHHACNRRCPKPSVIQALINACPEHLLAADHEKGWLPLHYACRFKLPKPCVALLLLTNTEWGKLTVSKRDRLGRTPLYYAVRYDAPPGVVGLLLQMDPSVVLEEDLSADSPLALVWDSWAEKLEGKRMVHSFLPGGFDEPADISVEERAKLLRARIQTQPKLWKRWNKANMLLKAAFGFPVEDDDDEENETDKTDTVADSTQRTWRIVHATAAVKCHYSLFLLACALHPEQVAELDCGDLLRPGDNPGSHQTALHLAASSNAGGEAGKSVVLTLLSLYRQAAQITDGDGSLPLHRMVENPRKKDWPQHGAILYHFYPPAVQIADHSGRLPLHRAAAMPVEPQPDADDDSAEDNNDDDDTAERSIIVQLVRAFPQAASRADKAGYLPLHLAASSGHAWDEDTETIHNAHRAAVQARAGPDHRLALHMATASPRAPDSLLQKLLELHPRAATIPDRNGYLPLHLACLSGGANIALLQEAFPAAVRQSASDWLPLHMACASLQGTDALIPQLVSWFPEAASTMDSSGRYPLHLACASGKSWTAIQALLHADATLTATPDQQGVYPFQAASMHFCRKGPRTSLPTWCREKGQEDREAVELDILFQLLRSDPTIL